MANYWIKLYHEILHDPKMIRLPERLFALAIKLFLLAGETNNNGYLPTVDDIAVVLRMEEEYLESAMIELSYVGILSSDSGRWYVTHFVQRQKPADGAERVKRYRQRLQKTDYYPEEERNEACNETLPTRYTDKIRIDKDTDTDKKQTGGGGEIFDAYEGNIGSLTGMVGDELMDLEKEYTTLWVVEAIRVAVVNEKRNLAYVKGVLKRWKREGFKSDIRKPAQSQPEEIYNVTQARLAKAEK